MALERLSQITESGIKNGITISNASVTGVLTASSVTVTGNSTVSGNSFVDGKLGIGTDNPSTTIHLVDSVPTIRFENTEQGPTVYGSVGGNGGNIILKADEENASGSTRIAFEIDGSEKLRITSGGELLVATTVGVGSTTQNIQVGQQILAPLGIISNNGYWSGVPGRLVSLNRAGDGINTHTAVLTINDIIGGPGSNGSASFMVWFSMRRGNTNASYSQQSQYMGLWHVTRQSTNLIRVTRHDIVNSELTIVSLVGAGADTDTTTLTLTFDTTNVRSYTDYAVHFCANNSPYPGATA